MKNKFKAGDLVTLSAAGKKAISNIELIGGFGFIETIMTDKPNPVPYPIKCKWWKEDMTVCTGHFKPYELKFYKNN
jgi:uncharacterized protein YodC (DUF2158 family)